MPVIKKNGVLACQRRTAISVLLVLLSLAACDRKEEIDCIFELDIAVVNAGSETVDVLLYQEDCDESTGTSAAGTMHTRPCGKVRHQLRADSLITQVFTFVWTEGYGKCWCCAGGDIVVEGLLSNEVVFKDSVELSQFRATSLDGGFDIGYDTVSIVF